MMGMPMVVSVMMVGMVILLMMAGMVAAMSIIPGPGSCIMMAAAGNRQVRLIPLMCRIQMVRLMMSLHRLFQLSQVLIPAY